MSSTPQIMLESTENNVISLIKIILVLCMRGSSIIIQLGTFPTENIYNIIFQNIVDVSISILSFTFVGYTVAYGTPDVIGVIGYGTCIGSKNVNSNEIIEGFCAVLIGSSVITSLLSGRMHFCGTLIVGMLYNGILLPVTMHAIWHENGLLKTANIYNTDVSLVDYGGGFVIHTTAGIVGLVGSYILGPRLLRLSEIDASSVGVESPGVTCLGYFLYMLGLIGMVLPVQVLPSKSLNVVLINCIVSIGVAILLTIIIELRICRGTFNYWSFLRCIQSGLAVLVFISSGVVYYNILVAIALSLISTIIFTLVSHVMHMSAIEDYSNITAIHTVSGFIGVFFPKMYFVKEYDFRQIFFAICSPLLFSGLFSLLLALVCFVIYSSINSRGILRNKSDAICYRRNKNLSRNIQGIPGLKRLFGLDRAENLLEPGVSCKATSTINTKCDQLPEKTDAGSRCKIASKDTFATHNIKSEFNEINSSYSSQSVLLRKSCVNGEPEDDKQIYNISHLMSADNKLQDLKFNSSGKTDQGCKLYLPK